MTSRQETTNCLLRFSQAVVAIERAWRTALNGASASELKLRQSPVSRRSPFVRELILDSMTMPEAWIPHCHHLIPTSLKTLLTRSIVIKRSHEYQHIPVLLGAA